ncbi:hypothetical protein CEXT_418541 [Caerostris extrusa]|uniref:Uncharacterized protein n=1 Tax=Caerostris extrusa TaxID=172846 RepID=A0AAV4VL10_CAEEX|nr:hypothetical protein CEXT_418541 [Caerostris extrusa]
MINHLADRIHSDKKRRQPHVQCRVAVLVPLGRKAFCGTFFLSWRYRQDCARGPDRVKETCPKRDKFFNSSNPIPIQIITLSGNHLGEPKGDLQGFTVFMDATLAIDPDRALSKKSFVFGFIHTMRIRGHKWFKEFQRSSYMKQKFHPMIVENI